MKKLISSSDKKKRTRKLINKVYLTKRRLNAIVESAFQDAAKKAMEDMGYIVTEKNGFVMRINADGTETILSKIPVNHRSKNINLD